VESNGSWLLPGGGDRERMLDMERRLQRPRRTAFAVLAVALVASGPWLGFWTLIPLAFAAVAFRVADALVDRAARPELVLFAAWAMSETIIAVSVALTGGPAAPTLCWLALPIVTLSARFSARGVGAGVALAVACLLGAAFGVDPGAVVDDPTPVVGAFALIVGLALLSVALMESDVEHRSEAVIDQLTGMLNRKALERRVEELHQQSRITGDAVGVVVGDIDHFKRVNDERGHAAGDGVLKDVAYLIRKHLRSFDLAYRLGGEEFVVLVPGADAHAAAELAERLRVAIEAGALGGGTAVTMSFGVSASRRGDAFHFAAVLAEADDALYAAKGAGRNRVCLDGSAVALAV
jgi:diguanylate cyclase (GGDEF)-like protein